MDRDEAADSVWRMLADSHSTVREGHRIVAPRQSDVRQFLRRHQSIPAAAILRIVSNALVDSSHGEHLRAEWVERLCEELQLDADSVWMVTAWVFAARHELSGAEGELHWLALDPWRPRMVQPREPGRWRQSVPGQVAALRDKLKRTPDAVEVLVEAMTDPDEDMRVFWNERLGYELKFTCRRVLFALKDAVNDLPLAGPPSCAPWEVYVGRCLIDMWITAGRRPSLPHGSAFRAAPLLRFARAWLRLMGAEHPEAAVREAKRTHAEWRKCLQEPSDADSSE